ncbi:MAG: hypothetical protein QXI36_04135 [Candidatus Bathyarchaeia archaeon]
MDSCPLCCKAKRPPNIIGETSALSKLDETEKTAQASLQFIGVVINVD